MRYLRFLSLVLSPFLIVGACSKDEEHHGSGKSGNEAGEAGNGEAGNGGSGRGGTSGTSGTVAGEAGSAGEPEGGSAGKAAGGTAGKGGAGKGGAGGSAGSETGGTAATGGEGASSGASGAGAGGEGGDCVTVSIPLRGASFDSDTGAWVPYDDGIGPARPIIVTADSQGITADTPPNVAHLGGENGDMAGMYQPITIPRGAVTLTLTGYRQVKTLEGTTRLDEMAIQLWQDSPSTTGFIGEFLSLGNDNPSDTWAPFSGTVAVDDYAGSTVHLDMWAETDVSLITDFYVDSLVLTAMVCDQ